MSARGGFFAKVLRKLRAVVTEGDAEPARQALARGKRVALVLLSPKDDNLAWLREVRQRGVEVDILPLFQPFKRADGEMMAFVYAPPREAYDAIVVDSRIALFEHSWSYAFLDRLNSLLDSKGALLVAKNQLPRARLDELFRGAPVHAGERYLTYEKANGGLARPPEAPLSTLDAYWPLMDSLIHNRFDSGMRKTVRGLGATHSPWPPESTKPLTTLLESQSYRTNSVRTKAAAVQHLVSVYFPGRSDLHLADLGAGTGLNSMELLLSDSGVAALTLVETMPHLHWSIAAVYRWLGERVRDRVTIFTGPVEEYKGRPADIAMVCGVYSVLPRGQRASFTQSAWDNLAPGGILAVLENMQDSDPVRGGDYNATRLTPQEADATLGRFGPVRYFSQTLRELEPAEVGNASVFRVIRKP